MTNVNSVDKDKNEIVQVNEDVLPGFSFDGNFDKLNPEDIQFKNGFKYKIVHPFMLQQPGVPIEKIPQIEVELHYCILYKGVPNGPAYIIYNSSDPFKFTAIGVFTDGKLHMGPLTVIATDNYAYYFSNMIDGRPVDSNDYIHFYPPGSTRQIKSLENPSNVGGMVWCLTQQQGVRWHGHGKMWLTEGRLFTGEFKQNRMSEGKMCVL